MQAGHEKNVQQPPDYPSGPLGLEKTGGLTSILIWTRSRRRCGPPAASQSSSTLTRSCPPDSTRRLSFSEKRRFGLAWKRPRGPTTRAAHPSASRGAAAPSHRFCDREQWRGQPFHHPPSVAERTCEQRALMSYEYVDLPQTEATWSGTLSDPIDTTLLRLETIARCHGQATGSAVRRILLHMMPERNAYM